MENYLNIVSVPAIATIVYWVINALKYAFKSNEKFLRIVPLVAMALGAVCGVISFYALPSIIPAENLITAIIIGGASGLTATGYNQIIKQLTKASNDEEEKR